MKCAVFCCRNNRRRRFACGKSFFRFPKDRDFRELWLRSISRTDYIPSEGSNVCEDHFSETFLLKRKKRMILDRGAIPEHDSSSCEKCSLICTYFPECSCMLQNQNKFCKSGDTIEHNQSMTEFEVSEGHTHITKVDFADFLTPAHKLVYLKYMQLNSDFVHNPECYPKLIEQLCSELNKISGLESELDWIGLMKGWVTFIRKKIIEIKKSKKNLSFTLEDFELLNMVDTDKIMADPSSVELNCILDHLEIAHSSPKVWLTIALELEALGAQPFKEEQWQKAFDRWTNKVKRKKIILDELELDDTERNSFLSPLEKRLLEFLNNIDNVKTEDDICRVCLESKTENLRDIHEYTADGITIVQKICECANVQVSKDDGLPQNICEICLNLLEEAYKFKHLCENSDYHLRNTEKASEKADCVEYIFDTLVDIDPQNIENLEDDDVQEDAVEINVTFEEEEKEDNLMNTVEKEIDTSLGSEEVELGKDIDTTIHQCEICGIICYNKVSLKKHMHSHTIERPYQCHICSKDFKTKLTLRVHMRSHTGERPYVCETCGKAFKTWSAVTNHRAIHSEVKMFQCQYCSYRGSTKANLQIHNRTHTRIQPYACDQCPLKFSTASNRNKHIKNVHEKLKLHKCGNCGRSFFSRESARKHMVIHTGLKPYTCTECPMAYGWYNGLQKHMKTQHPGIKMPTEKHFLDVMEK